MEQALSSGILVGGRGGVLPDSKGDEGSAQGPCDRQGTEDLLEKSQCDGLFDDKL